MKKFIDFLILFSIFMLDNYINEDWTTITKLGKFYYYPFWFIRSMIFWIICPIFIPQYFFMKSDTYKEIEKMLKTKGI